MSEFKQQNPDQDKAKAFLPLAEQLHAAVDGYIASEEVPSSHSIEKAFDQAFADAAPALIYAKLKELPPAQFAELYVRVLGSEALKTQLDELTAIKSAELKREVRLQSIQHEALTSRTLSLDKLLPDDVIKIYLFSPNDPSIADKKHRDFALRQPLHRVVALRMITPSDGEVEVVYDNWVGPVWARDNGYDTPPFPTLSRGTTNKRISVHAPLSFETANGDQFTHPQIVGFIESADDVLLLDARMKAKKTS